jgi:hypothetical protein
MLVPSALIPFVTQIATATLGSLCGAFLGYKLGVRSHVMQRRHDFIVDQLRDFYSPMLSFAADIEFEVGSCADWHDPSYFDNGRFLAKVWPLYRGMLTHFSTHAWLASPPTRAFSRIYWAPSTTWIIR